MHALHTRRDRSHFLRRYRNVSATLLELPPSPQPEAPPAAGSGGGGLMLLDAGEGTVGAMRRQFGAETASVILRLELVWISHMHADHHLGLLQVRDRGLLMISARVYL